MRSGQGFLISFINRNTGCTVIIGQLAVFQHVTAPKPCTQPLPIVGSML